MLKRPVGTSENMENNDNAQEFSHFLHQKTWWIFKTQTDRGNTDCQVNNGTTTGNLRGKLKRPAYTMVQETK